MAEVYIRRERSSPLPWLILALLIGILVWAMLSRRTGISPTSITPSSGPPTEKSVAGPQP